MLVSNFYIERFFLDKNPKKCEDLLPVESSLEVFLYSHTKKNYERLAVLMRTPCHDFELIVGFLFTEQIITNYSDITKLFYCRKVPSNMYGNTIKVILKPQVNIEAILENKRNFIRSSSCGICGELLIKENLYTNGYKKKKNPVFINKEFIFSIPKKSVKEQTTYKYTGGLHASSLFSLDGDLLSIKEDVGRHNALDKLIGFTLMNGKSDVLEKSLLLLSGRVSYELVQKSIVAKIPIICALGAPSTLSVELCKEYNIMLIGFLDHKKFNVYNSSNKVYLSEKASKVAKV